MATSEELSNRYWEMSEYLIRKAQEELDVSEDLMQAFREGLGVCCPRHQVYLRQTRGWNHHYHLLFRDAISRPSTGV